MGARVIALVVALGMVAGALAFRLNADRDGGLLGGGGRGPVRLVCATELADACRALASQDDGVDVTVEPATTTADRLVAVEADADPGLDGWLTPGPWPAMVDEARRPAGRPPLFADVADPIARSRLIVVLKRTGPAVECLTPSGGTTWSCVGDATSQIRIAIGSGTAVRLLGFAAVAGAYIDLAGWDVNDLTGEARAKLLAVRTESEAARSRAASFASPRGFLSNPAAVDALVVTEAEWARASVNAARAAEFETKVPSPAATADLHLGVGRNGSRGDRLRDLFTGDGAGLELVRQQGWRVPGREPLAGVDPGLPLPDDDGLPSAGVLQGLREVVQ